MSEKGDMKREVGQSDNHNAFLHSFLFLAGPAFLYSN